MLLNYFKIFLKVASQKKLFTFLSLFGISLTIMFIMIFSMTISKISSGSGPESELNKIILSDRVKTKFSQGFGMLSSCNRSLCEDYLKKNSKAKITSMFTMPADWEFILNSEYEKKRESQTDAEYWELFDFRFLQGRPYTRSEVTNRANVAVISRSLKELLFGEEKDVLGKTIHYTTIDLVVTGVVEDCPPTALNTAADLYYPYTIFPGINNGNNFLGPFTVAFKTGGSSGDIKAVRDEVQETIARLDAADTTCKVFFAGPYTQIEKLMSGNIDPEEFSKGRSILKYLLLGLAFLLLPAINLMSLNFARIHERGEEIAVRKSFGASGAILRKQFLFENLLMTLAGGLMGIILSYVVVALLGRTFTLGISMFVRVPLSFSFNLPVFVAALASCFIFGLLSGWLPAVRLARMKPSVILKGGEL